MADLARIKRNVAKMVGMGAPENDIDAYIGQEGVTVDQVRAFKGGATQTTAPAPPAPFDITKYIPNVSSPAFGVNAAESVPVVGPYLKGGMDNVTAGIQSLMQGKPFDQMKQQVEQSDQTWSQLDPASAIGGKVFGNVAPFALGGEVPVVAKALGMAGKVAPRMLFGGASGAAINGADTLARGGSPQDAFNAAVTGGAFGAGVPVAAKAIGTVFNGIKGAAGIATADDLGTDFSTAIKGTAGPMFDQVRASGVKLSPEAYTQFAQDTVRKVGETGLDKSLHPDTWALLTNMLARAGKSLDLGDLHIIRQLAQDASRGPLSRDSSKSRTVVRAVDDFIGALKPSDLIGGGGNVRAATKTLFDAISTWHRASKAATIEEAIYRGLNAKGAPQNGIINEMRKMLNDPETRRTFTSDERQLVESMVRGSVGSNLLKLVGKFGLGQNTGLMSALAGIGITATPLGPVGALGGLAAATAAKQASEKLTASQAQRLLTGVATGTMPAAPKASTVTWDMLRKANASPVALPVPGGSLPLLARQKQPVQITVIGGNGR